MAKEETYGALKDAVVEAYSAAIVVKLTALIEAAGMAVEPAIPLGLPANAVAYGSSAELKANTFRTIYLDWILEPRADIWVRCGGTAESMFYPGFLQGVGHRTDVSFPIINVGWRGEKFSLIESTPSEVGEHIWEKIPEEFRLQTPVKELIDKTKSNLREMVEDD